MSKIFLFSISLVIAFLNLSSSASISCSYRTTSYSILKDAYVCLVENDVKMTTRKSAQIISTSGNHLSGKTNDDVSCFIVTHKIVNYFPRGLETFFSNLKMIAIEACELKEIHQTDFKPFADLVELYFDSNSLEILEDGLFDYNPNLEYIHFGNNKITHIGSNVFDNLQKLRYLAFNPNPCINKDAQNLTSLVKDIIQEVKSKCVESDFSSINEKFENLTKESKTLNSEDFNKRLLTFENNFKNLKFFDFFDYKLEALKVQQLKFKSEIISNCSNCCHLSELDMKVVNMSQLVNEIWTNVNDLKISQSSMINVQDDINSSFGGFKVTLNDLKVTQHEVGSSQKYFSSSLDTLKISVNELSSSFVTKLENLKSAQDQIILSQDDIKSSIGDIEANLSGLKASQIDYKSSQNELKSSINKVKNSQNEMKILLDELKIHNSESSKEDLSTFSDKLESIEVQLTEFKGENTDKLGKIERELANTRHKIEITIDEKIKGIENRLMRKFEQVLEEKFSKILAEKL